MAGAERKRIRPRAIRKQQPVDKLLKSVEAIVIRRRRTDQPILSARQKAHERWRKRLMICTFAGAIVSGFANFQTRSR